MVRATASTKPGNPAPEPTSATRFAAARAEPSSPVRLSSTWTFQARTGSVTELTDARSSLKSSSTTVIVAFCCGSRGPPGGGGTSCTFSSSTIVLSRKRGSKKLSGAPSRRPSSLGNQRRDDHATPRLVAFAVGLDAGALFGVFVHAPPFLGAHRVHLDRDVAVQRLLGGAVGACRQHLAPFLPVAGGVEHDPLAVPHAAEGRLEAEQLQRVDRLPALADQQPVVVLAPHDGLDPLVILTNLHLTVQIQLIENPLDKLPDPLSGLLRPIRTVAHARQPIPALRDQGERLPPSEIPCSLSSASLTDEEPPSGAQGLSAVAASRGSRKGATAPLHLSERWRGPRRGRHPWKCLAKRLRRVILSREAAAT